MPTLASTRPYVYFLLFCSQTYSNPPFQCKTCEWLDHARSNCSSTCVMSVHALWHAGIFVCLCVCVCVCVCLCVCPLCYWLFVAHFDSRHFSTNNQCFHCACSDSSSACVVKSHLIYTCAMSIHVSNPNRHDQTCITSKHVQCPCMCQIQINMSKHVSHSNMCNVQACVKSKQTCPNMYHIQTCAMSMHVSNPNKHVQTCITSKHVQCPSMCQIQTSAMFKHGSYRYIHTCIISSCRHPYVPAAARRPLLCALPSWYCSSLRIQRREQGRHPEPSQHVSAYVFVQNWSSHTLGHNINNDTSLLGWPKPYIHTVYDRMYGDFPAKNTV